MCSQPANGQPVSAVSQCAQPVWLTKRYPTCAVSMLYFLQRDVRVPAPKSMPQAFALGDQNARLPHQTVNWYVCATNAAYKVCAGRRGYLIHRHSATSNLTCHKIMPWVIWQASSILHTHAISRHSLHAHPHAHPACTCLQVPPGVLSQGEVKVARWVHDGACITHTHQARTQEPSATHRLG